MILTSELLASQDHVVHGFTTRWRTGERLQERNLGVGTPVEVWSEVTAQLGAAEVGVALVSQVHGARILEARSPGVVGEADAVTTDRPGLLLAIRTADCVPILVVGPGRVTAIHAGWRGLAGSVIGSSLDRWSVGSGSVAAIGPCICVDCYEVGSEVIDGIGASVPQDVFRREGPSRAHADLRAAARWQLEQAGIERIETIEYCTRCDSDLHSHRRDGALAGRQAAIIGLVA